MIGTRRVFATAALAILIGAAGFSGRAQARHATGQNVAYLGKPTNDAPSRYVPIGGFHRVPEKLTYLGKPVVELIGTAVDSYTAAIEWPLIKALDQFGSFTGLKPAERSCVHTVPTPTEGENAMSFSECGTPSFDFTHASYRSPYISFRARMLIDTNGNVHVSSLTSSELKLYRRYGRTFVSSDEYKNITASLYPPNFNEASRRLPLVSIGNYLETHDLYVYPQNDFGIVYRTPYTPPNAIPFLTFAQAHNALTSHKQPKLSGSWTYTGSILADVNTDANLIAAVICKADKSKPKSACGRAVVAKIVKRLK